MASIGSRTGWTLATVALAFALSACGTTTIDQTKAEDLVKEATSAGTIKAESATCPGDVEAKKGETFDCKVTYTDDTTATVTVRIRSDDGDVTVTPDDIKQDQ